MRVGSPARAGLRMECADGRRLVLVQESGGRGAVPVLFARQRVTHRGLHYARTGRYVSPLAPLRAGRARAHAELAEGGRPEVLILSRAADPAWTALLSERPVVAYEERMAALGDGPLRAVRASGEARRLAREPAAAADVPALTRAWPFPGGVAGREAAAAAYVPGRRPDAER
ncbi:hypothetical protein [Streptomyces roseolus]|uniref:hypothetical protein n=2 Tax=Streptomyces roseolus TaxID=67358 RepID=UPI003663C4DE